MTEYLAYNFDDSPDFIETFDELPLWSASFGLLMLRHIELKPNLKVIDIGSGAGFPLMELAARLGNSSKLYGVDPWVSANIRAKKKINNYGLTNVEIIECSAEKIPLEDKSIDLIVSNLGINNFDQPDIVFGECHRLLKPKGKLVLTTNLNGHWKEFYHIFESTLKQLGKEKLPEKLEEHQRHRGNVETIAELFEKNGFTVYKFIEENFEMKFLDGTAFLNHYFVKLGWLSSWKSLLPEEELVEIFSALESNLNKYSTEYGGLNLTVPMAYFEAQIPGI